MDKRQSPFASTSQTPKKQKLCQDSDLGYFGSYEQIGIHAEMIDDRIRTSSYKLAILRNYDRIRGKVVMDIGAGTGILSVFCVQAGAKKVYAIEASNIAEQTKLVVRENNMEDRIEVIQQQVEELELDVEVDVIVSEWMGYLLFYENMLPSVLYARDKWLKKGGLMLPSSATLYISAYSDSECYDSSISFWDQVEDLYGAKMSCMKPFAQRCLANTVHVSETDPEDIVSHAAPVVQLDLTSIAISELNSIQSLLTLVSFGEVPIHGFATWFDVEFPKDVTLSTSPYGRATHWEQCILYLDAPIQAKQGTQINVNIKVEPHHKNKRFLDIKLQYSVDDAHFTQDYFMNDNL